MAIRDKLSEGVKSGVVWHTQGSGKTALSYYLTYILNDFYAKQKKVAKFYFIVDRLDLLEQAKQEGGRLVRVSVISGMISGLVLLLLSPLVMRFAGHLTDTAQGYLRFMLYVCCYYMVGKSVNGTVIAGVFCAGGDTRFGLICDTVNMWCVIVPLGLLAAFVFKWSVPVVYFLLNLDEFTKMPAEWIHYHKYKWVRNLTGERSSESA